MVPRTVKYELVYRSLLELARQVAGLSRAQKDEELEKFAHANSQYIMIGVREWGIPEVFLPRNFSNYLKCNGYDVKTIQQKFEEFARRRSPRQ